MKFILDAEGIKITFEIKNYRKTTNKDDPDWCECSYSFIAGKWLNYSGENEEVLTCDEIEYLLEEIEKLLNDQLESDEELEFIEPDFSFELVTKKDLRNDERVIYIAKGHEIVDIKVANTYSFIELGNDKANNIKKLEGLVLGKRKVVVEEAKKEPTVGTHTKKDFKAKGNKDRKPKDKKPQKKAKKIDFDKPRVYEKTVKRFPKK